jgi:RNA polymerase-binding transcription factor DksA
MNNIDTEKFKKMLEEELGSLESSLSKIGRRNPDNPEDWEAVPEEWDTTGADKNESADRIEEFEENTAKLKELEIRYNNIKRALKKIEDNTYGKDEIDGSDIPIERLEANPAARTKVENSHLIEE